MFIEVHSTNYEDMEKVIGRWNAFEEGGPLADISNPAALPRVLEAVNNLMPLLLHANGTPLIDGLDAEIIALDEAMDKLGVQP
jgi:hypothetical protein